MKWNEYEKLSEVTEKKFDDGLSITNEDYSELLAECECIIDEPVMDRIKKDLIYNEHDTTDITLTKDQAEMLHAAMGFYTESIEILEVVWRWVRENQDLKELDRVNVQEELGDASWYAAIMTRKLNINPSDALKININKLKKRYPEKYSNDSANNRDLKVERTTLEQEQKRFKSDDNDIDVRMGEN